MCCYRGLGTPPLFIAMCWRRPHVNAHEERSEEYRAPCAVRPTIKLVKLSPPLRGENSAPKVSRSTSRTGHMHVYIACRAHTLARATSCSRHPSRVESFYAVELLQHPKVRALDGLILYCNVSVHRTKTDRASACCASRPFLAHAHARRVSTNSPHQICAPRCATRLST